jgi:DNA-binding MarR family transcriptional regulator
MVLDSFVDEFQTTYTTDDAILKAAIPRLFKTLGFSSITRSQQEVMIALLARRNYKAPTDIHESAWNQAIIAKATNVSRSTVKRAYKVFEEMGWLIRNEQSYDIEHKRFCGTPLSFDHQFVTALNLHQTFNSAAMELVPRELLRNTKTEPTEKTDSPIFFSAVAHCDTHIKEDSVKQLKDNPAAPAQAQKPVPPELRCLADSGLSCWTVFWLMKQASQAGKRLSDIVEACRTAIDKREGKALLGLLRMKIADNVDYRWKVKSLQKVAADQAAVRHAEQFLERIVGKNVVITGFANPFLLTVTSSGCFYAEGNGKGGIPHGELLRLAKVQRISVIDGPVAVSSEATKGPVFDNAGSRAAAKQAIVEMMAKLRSSV